jgi:hypothetical protein
MWKPCSALPDATAETVLRPVLSYDDFSFFHFDVPQDTSVAHWEFAAFQDDKSCPNRQVFV